MAKDNLKILIIPTWYPMPEDDMGGIYHRQQGEALAEREDAEVYVLFMERRRLQKPLAYLQMPKTVVEQDGNMTVFRRRILNLETLQYDLYLKSYCRGLFKAYADFEKQYGKPDVIQAHVSLPAGYAAVLLGKSIGVPVVITEHASYFTRFFDGKFAKYGNTVLKDCARFSVVSKSMKERMPDESIRCDIIPNFIDCGVFDRPPVPRQDEVLRLVNVSPLREIKRVDDIMRALQILIYDRGMLNIHLDVIGDGYYKEAYRKMRDEMDLQGYVSFLGAKKREEIAEIFSKSDMLIIASSIETFGIPGIEALAAGLPVVSSRCGGPSEYLDEQSGEMCNVGDPKDMADAIQKVADKLPGYDRDYLKSIARRYDKETVCQQLMDVFREVTGD